MVSVIIPVYCAQATLRECLDSVLSQSLRELEVICVDDGSTDESVSILREYADQDTRVRVLEQKNQFAGAARNKGIDAAKGKYVAFLDADDLYLPNALKTMHDQAEEYRLDMLKTGFVYENVATGQQYENPYSQNSTVHSKWRQRVVTFGRIPEQLLDVADVPWNGLYRRAFLKECGIRFNGLRCVNDHSFFIHCLLKARRIMVCDCAAVCYRVGRQNSLVGQRADYFSNQLESYNIVRELCRKEKSKRASLVMERELTGLFRWYGELRAVSKNPESMDRLMEGFVRSMDESDVGGVFLRTFEYKEQYYSMRYGSGVPECPGVFHRTCERIQRRGICYVFLRVVRKPGKMRELFKRMLYFMERLHISKKLFRTAALISPYWNTQLCFLRASGHTANLECPTTFSEKLSWLKLNCYARDPLVKQCADKYMVRSYVKEKGLEHILNELLGTWHNPDDISWETLPDSFALKWNFGCGFNLLCKQKADLDIAQVTSKLKHWGRDHFWLEYAELQYKVAEKRILCERYLDTASGIPLLDYKFYCFHGKPLAVLVIARPEGGEKAAVFMSPEWDLISDIPARYKESLVPQKPACWAEMLQVAESLSEPFPFVRVDLYNHDGRVIFGEMTFTPSAGIFPSETRIDGKAMGEYLDLGI